MEGGVEDSRLRAEEYFLVPWCRRCEFKETQYRRVLERVDTLRLTVLLLYIVAQSVDGRCKLSVPAGSDAESAVMLFSETGLVPFADF